MSFGIHRLSVLIVSAVVVNVLSFKDLRFRPHGDSLLHTAAAEGCLAGAQWLLDKGARTDKPNKGGQEAVHLAAKNGHQRLLRLLALHNVSLARPDVTGQTPIYLFAKCGLPGSGRVITGQLSTQELMRPVSDHKAWTALHWAAYNGNADLVMALVEGGAFVNQKTSNGETPLDLAFEGANFRIWKARREKADRDKLESLRDSEVQLVNYMQKNSAMTNKLNPHLLSKEDD